MSLTCDNCGKGRQRGHRVSHAKNRSIHFFKPNLHRHRVLEKGIAVIRVLCSHCLKKLKRPTNREIVKARPLRRYQYEFVRTLQKLR
ncbi:hypothetical protein HYU89_00325 [Candidatus Collierbacteria bacterium]|nr:hypothetical protein [Candidatus Collierbacteria bacterium]